MDNLQEICDYLKTITKLTNNCHKESIDWQTFDEIVSEVCHLCDNDLNFADIYSTIESDLNELMADQTLDGRSRGLWRSADAMIRCIVLLNPLNAEELVSNQNFMTIRLTVIKVISMTIIPYVSQHFQRITELFLTIDGNGLTQTDRQLISRQFVLNLTTILIRLLNAKSLISRILLEDCFAPLMASLMTVRHDSESDVDKEMIGQQLSSLLTDFDHLVVIRNLLLLSRCRAIKWSNNEISKCLSQCLCQRAGLLSLINAVVDTDQTSQRQTTLHQRYQAIGTIVSAMPALYCSLRQYYEIIGGQVLELLLSVDPNHHTIGSIILMSLENRNQKLSQELITDKILNLFLKTETEQPIDGSIGAVNAEEGIDSQSDNELSEMKQNSLTMCLQIVKILLKEKDKLKSEDTNQLKQLVPSLDVLSMNQSFDETLRNTAIEMKNQIELFSNHKDFIGSNSKLNNEFELAMTELNDPIMPARAHALIKLKQLIYAKDKQLLDNRSQLINALKMCLNDTESYIYLSAVNTLSTLAIQCTDDVLPVLIQEFADNELSEMKQNSLTMCLQIVKILLKEKDKLKSEDTNQLKQLVPSLNVLSMNQAFDETLRNTAIEMKNQIELFSNHKDFIGGNSKLNNEFELAMTELNDPIMPARAHALIKLKQLIYAKDKQLLDNRSQLINALKMCLNDTESYIYLSAVNTLSTLAIQCTDDVLPVLIQEFADSERPVEERVKVGEVLVRLSKCIGDFGHHYSRQYITCFLNGAKSPEPAIRISSLSNLGQFCGSLRFALKPYLVELMSCVEALLKTDHSIEVKRSSVMLLHLMLKGIDRDTIEAVDQLLKEIYRLLRHVYSTTIDDILQLHAQLAINEIDRIVKEMFQNRSTSITKNIQILSL
ncbi:unnamed protein product [Medioppia subpectinata]|uniref:Uncharacterized protein n=1 Tax=Medioppia subpectinata TaxID=1979941 RepID=A0A7R9KUA8_9ACAR|nr:unnamed protein product [Medioppia subpectinata]CAG2110004.1 unnamed protein product [Medioppia subpectinata]